jgi:hypothetical protein
MISGGMLKIDAVSLADTLEGYPDLFVSALLGGAICEEVVVDDDDNVDYEEEEEEGPLVNVGTLYYTAESSSYVVRNHHHHHNNHHNNNNNNNNGTTFQSLGSMSPEVVEGQIEALFTMCSFIIASLIPSVTYALLLHYASKNVVYNNNQEEIASFHANDSKNYKNNDEEENDIVALRHALFTPAQVSVVISAIVMFLLGIWKR